jgi:peptidoglycan/xylan/chitin deacetylase (PgdA/CDA1 family)
VIVRSVAAGAAAAHLLPSVAAIGPLRTRAWPALCGVSRSRHIALTFDDGPDPSATPALLDALGELGVRATFFVLGERLAQHPQPALRAAAEGHEVAVHGWTHRPHLLRTPPAVAADIGRAAQAVTDTTGRRPRYWRPPHGIPTGAGLWAAHRLDLRPVLWTADGREWRPDATAGSVRARIVAGLAPGAVVLLHDSDALAVPGTWRRALAALPHIVDASRELGCRLGPLAEHLAGGRHAAS